MGITRDYVRENLSYDSRTGIFRWVKRGRGRKCGAVAGCDDGSGYIVIRLGGVRYKAHRLAWLHVTGYLPRRHIDHINHDKSDNKWSNLRDVTTVQNARNQNISVKNTSGTTGVSFSATTNRWIAKIGVNGDRVHLGVYKLKNDAVSARKSAEKKYGFHANHGAS